MSDFSGRVALITGAGSPSGIGFAVARILGEGGARMKAIGSAARRDMERLFGDKVFLEIWVRVKSGWADDERMLNRIGY